MSVEEQLCEAFERVQHGGLDERGEKDIWGGVIRGKTKACEVCGVVITIRNMARNMDTQHRTWDPGGLSRFKREPTGSD